MIYLTDELDKKQHKHLAENGFIAFNMDKNSIYKDIRYRILQKYKDSEFEGSSATMYQSALDYFIDLNDLERVQSYPVLRGKRDKHKEQITKTDFYTTDEVIELAYYIELGLADKTISQYEKLLFTAGRMFIKSGWNLTPTFELCIDDLMMLDAPISGKSCHAIRLFKRRANYQTQWYKFDIEADSLDDEGVIIGKEVTNIVKDFEKIRDSISYEIRKELPDDHPFKKRLMLYKSDDKTWGLGLDCIPKLQALLDNLGCKVPFVQGRIRKGGLNYIYKKVSKNFREYVKAGHHSLPVFLESYLRLDVNTSEDKISSAVTIMGDYFHGRKLAENVIILTDKPSGSRQTPNGSCMSKGNDDAAKAYNKQHKRLHRDNDTETEQCADFNACLWCPYFRLVADPEHVWRLLSYKNYVLDEMESNIGDYELSGDQQEFIDKLNERVEQILIEISELNQSAVDEGRERFKEKGPHEDWALVTKFSRGL